MTNFNPKEWNPSYLAYCRSEGVTDPNDLPKPEGFEEGSRLQGLAK